MKHKFPPCMNRGENCQDSSGGIETDGSTLEVEEQMLEMVGGGREVVEGEGVVLEIVHL